MGCFRDKNVPMEHNFTNVIQGEKITEEKTNEIIRQSLDNLFFFEDELIRICKKLIRRECEKITTPFVNTIQYYLCSKEKESYDYIVKTFIQNYEAFTNEFNKVLESNRYNIYIFSVISHVWTEVVEEFEKEARTYNDMIASSIAIQLQKDMDYIVDDVFENKKSSN